MKIINIPNGIRLKYQTKSYLFVSLIFIILSGITFGLGVYYNNELVEVVWFSVLWLPFAVFFILRYKTYETDILPDEIISRVTTIWMHKTVEEFRYLDLETIQIELSLHNKNLNHRTSRNHSRNGHQSGLFLILILYIADFLGVISNVKWLCCTKSF